MAEIVREQRERRDRGEKERGRLGRKILKEERDRGGR